MSCHSMAAVPRANRRQTWKVNFARTSDACLSGANFEPKRGTVRLIREFPASPEAKDVDGIRVKLCGPRTLAEKTAAHFPCKVPSCFSADTFKCWTLDYVADTIPKRRNPLQRELLFIYFTPKTLLGTSSSPVRPDSRPTLVRSNCHVPWTTLTGRRRVSNSLQAEFSAVPLRLKHRIGVHILSWRVAHLHDSCKIKLRRSSLKGPHILAMLYGKPSMLGGLC